MSDWHILSSVETLNQAIKESNAHPIALFKHSTRCPISTMAKSRLERTNNDALADRIYYLDLLKYRDISNAIAEKLSVNHESPQVIVVKNGKAAYVATHNSITPDDLEVALELDTN